MLETEGEEIGPCSEVGGGNPELSAWPGPPFAPTNFLPQLPGGGKYLQFPTGAFRTLRFRVPVPFVSFV